MIKVMIETGVDKLVTLINNKKRISIPNAAKDLGLTPSVIEEWADFLEEEGIIGIEYKFATPYLVVKKLTKKDIKVKEKEFHGEKEGFIRKVESTLTVLDKEDDNFQKFKDQFVKLKKQLGSDLSHVEAELKQLEKYEELKGGVDKQILEHEKEFSLKMVNFEREIKTEQSKFSDIISELAKEEEKLDRGRLEALSLKEKEINMRKKVSEFQNNIDLIIRATKNEEIEIDNIGKRIKELKNKSENIKNDILSKSKKGTELINNSNKHKKRILVLQNEILKKVSKNKEEIANKISEGKSSTLKFRDFFEKKNEIEKTISEMDKQKDELENQLIFLIKKAKAFHLSSSSSSLSSHIKELQENFDKINKEKTKFEFKANKLSLLMKK